MVFVEAHLTVLRQGESIAATQPRQPAPELHCHIYFNYLRNLSVSIKQREVAYLICGLSL